VLRAMAQALAHPLMALAATSLVFWGWHVPAVYQLALRAAPVHLVEHASFFAAGLLFWYVVVQPWPSRPRWPRGAMIPFLLAADVQNSMLAAVLTFSDRVLYPFYQLDGRVVPADALDDQVLAGVIMWVPMSLAYLVPAALLTIRLMSPRTAVPLLSARALEAPAGARVPTRCGFRTREADQTLDRVMR